MTITVLVTARSLCANRGKPWEMLEHAGCQIIPNPHGRPLSEDELATLWREVDGAILGLDAATARAIAEATKLRVIARYGVGVDNVDVDAATARGIVVTNAPGASVVAVSELAVGMVLALARQIPQHDRRVRAGSWSRITGTELSGKTVGLIGFGRIGRAVAKRVAAFDARIVYHDPVRPSREEEAALDATFASLDTIFSTSDFISLHATVNETTEKIVNARTLKLMKPTAFLVNTARGELVDEPALIAALRAGQIGGAALDTRIQEPSSPNDPLAALDNVILTPHIGATTREATLHVGMAAVRSVMQVLQGEKPPNVVNPQVYSTETERHRERTVPD